MRKGRESTKPKFTKKRKQKRSKFSSSKKSKTDYKMPQSSKKFQVESSMEQASSDQSEGEDMLGNLRNDLEINISSNSTSDEELSIAEHTEGDSLELNLGHDIESDHEEKPDEDSDENNEENMVSLSNKELSEEDVVDNFSDPFVKHLHVTLHPTLLDSLQASTPIVSSSIEHWPSLENLLIKIPLCSQVDTPKESLLSSLEEKEVYTQGGHIPKIYDLKQITDGIHIKPQITRNLEKINLDQKGFLNPLQNELFSIINNYQDLYFAKRTFSNAEDIRFIYCLHSVNHILKTRIKIIHHNGKLSQKNDATPEDYRDQGFVRPKILILVPFKDSAYKIISLIEKILLSENNGNVMNKQRFISEFTGNEITMPRKNPKPSDFEFTFTGNCDDDFKIGISVTKKSLKLFVDFYSADIIIASPLGLRRVIGATGESQRDYDFLASIELLILDQAEIFLMQNWDHVVHVFQHLHLQLKESRNTDFSRVRQWSLNGHAKFYRQSLIFSSLVWPEIYGVYNKHCLNYAGRVDVTEHVEKGFISQVMIPIPQRFHKFTADGMFQSIDNRYEFFVNNILPHYKDIQMKQTMIFIPNYFDYVKLRNYFKKEMLSFTQICEYSKEGKIARARDMFFHGYVHFILYTERFHFYNRIKLKGVQHLVFYAPPYFPHFYSEMCNFMQENPNMTVSVMYSKYDISQLSAIVGTDRARKMIKSERNVHLLTTE